MPESLLKCDTISIHLRQRADMQESSREFVIHSTPITLSKIPLLIFNFLITEGEWSTRLKKFSTSLHMCSHTLLKCGIFGGPPTKPILKWFHFNTPLHIFQICCLISWLYTFVHADGPWIMTVTCSEGMFPPSTTWSQSK